MYKYEDLKPEVFKEESQRDFLRVYDTVKEHPSQVITMEEAIANTTGDNWVRMAFVDRLAELGIIYPLRQVEDTPAHARLFRKT